MCSYTGHYKLSMRMDDTIIGLVASSAGYMLDEASTNDNNHFDNWVKPSI